MDILQWLIQHRKAVAEKFNLFGDRQFSELCQHWLHVYTKNVRLNRLEIDSADGMLVEMDTADGNTVETRVPFAQVSMPPNIVDVDYIILRFLDFNVLEFLRRMPTLISNTRRLDLICWQEKEAPIDNLLTTFQHMLPLFTGIGTIFLEGHPPFFERILQRIPATIINKLRYLELSVEQGLLPEGYVKFIAEWLSTRQENCCCFWPRICGIGCEGDVQGMSPEQMGQLLAIIREIFLRATTSTSFFFVLTPPSLAPYNAAVQELHIENGTTGEQLIVQKLEEEDGDVLLVGRCSSHFDGNSWMQEHKKNVMDESPVEKTFTIFCPEIGNMGEENPAKEEAEDDDFDQPGPSKKRRRLA